MLPVKFGSIWPSRFRGENETIKFMDNRHWMPSDDKSSNDLWQIEVKNYRLKLNLVWVILIQHN